MASNSSIDPSDALATTAVRVAVLDASQPQTPLHNATLDMNVIHAREDAGEDDAMREAITTGESGDIDGGNNAGGVRDVEHNGNNEDDGGDEDDDNDDNDNDVDEEVGGEEEVAGMGSGKEHEPQHATDASSADNASSKDGPSTDNFDAELEMMKKRLQQMEEEVLFLQGDYEGEAHPERPEAAPDTPAQSAANGPTGGVNHVYESEPDSPAPTNPIADEATSESDA